jgi:hypothetical protein
MASPNAPTDTEREAFANDMRMRDFLNQGLRSKRQAARKGRKTPRKVSRK